MSEQTAVLFKGTVPPPKPMRPYQPPAAAPAPNAGNGEDEVITYDPMPRRPTSPKIDPDVYTVRLVDVRTERGPNKFRPGEERTSRVWDFELVDQKSPDHEGVLRKWTGVTGDAFIEVMKALKVPPGEVPKGKLVGRQCRAVVELTDKGYARMSRLFPMT